MISLWMNTFWQIIYREIKVFAKVFFSKFIDLIIMTTTNILVFAYIMPYFGLQTTYGGFVVIGLIPMICFFEVIMRVSTLVMDLTSTKKISYLLTLPLPSSLAISAIPFGWAAVSMIYTILILPVSKLILWSELSLAEMSISKFILAFIIINLFFAFFALWLASLIKDMKYISWIWARVVNPLFMLGGFFYTWYAVYSKAHFAAILNLFNPVLYTSEIIRSSVFGSKGYIPYSYCLLALIGFILIFGAHGIYRLKKRLDCV